MELKRINTRQRMSDMVIHNGVAYLAGKVPTDLNADICDQTAEVLSIIEDLLQEAGSSKDRILRAEIYLSDMDHFTEMNAVWDSWVAPGAAPARATVEARLADKECLVEIVVTAAVEVIR